MFASLNVTTGTQRLVLQYAKIPVHFLFRTPLFQLADIVVRRTMAAQDASRTSVRPA
jgi:hypothetical protein